MRKIFIMAIAMSSILLYSCKKETIKDLSVNETEGLIKVQEIANDTNVVELYTNSGSFLLGYNEVYLRIRDKISNSYDTDAVINWNPLMHMMSMTHSCPKSEVEKVAGKSTLYKGYLVFQMPGNSSEKWTLTLNYETKGIPFVVQDTLSVLNSSRKRVASFVGADSVKYIVALIAPSAPGVAINDMTLGLFAMQNKMSFPVVENYTVEIDPRMPAMGNHGSPNNVGLTYSAADKLYHGKLSLTMTGYWKINLIVKNPSADIIKGEAVTDVNESSSLYLELEF